MRFSCATVGAFDGVHLGHQKLVRELYQVSVLHEMDSYVITFDRHPKFYFDGFDSHHLIDTPDEKIYHLTQYCDTLLPHPPKIVVLPFSQIVHKTASQFIKFLKDQYGASIVVMGNDNRFGSDGILDFGYYEDLARQNAISIQRVSPFFVDGQKVSSTLIRQLLLQGQVEKANHLLCRPFFMSGEVVRGKGIGHQINFPTANLLINVGKLLPCDGVYSVQVSIENDKDWHPALLNIGNNPTISDEGDKTIEVHIPHFHQDIYGKRLRVQFYRFVRAERRFETIAQLQEQIQHDLQFLSSMIQ